MPFSPLFIFTFTPLPWALILCLVLYRHNLSQLFHPVREMRSIRDWKQMFRYLEISIDGSSNSREFERSNIPSIWKDLSERYPNTKFYISVIASIAILSSASSAVILTGSLSFIDPRLTFLLAAGLQSASSLPSIFLMQRHFGSFPSPPFRFHLKKSRSGSLLKYESILRTLDSES